ncbi:hypothetical protein ACPXCX_57580, partial [Streptomyces sp. DT225]
MHSRMLGFGAVDRFPVGAEQFQLARQPGVQTAYGLQVGARVQGLGEQLAATVFKNLQRRLAGSGVQG